MASEYDILLRLLIAVLIGGAIGLERELTNQPAGLRTHIIVTLGAALIMIISKYGFLDVADMSKDPGRLAAQVVSGIGFLGAGTIIVHRNMVRGLTTAASLWTSAAIGLAIGAGFYVAGVGAAFFLITTLWILGRVEAKFSKKKYKKIHIKAIQKDTLITRMEQTLEMNEITLNKIEVKKESIINGVSNCEVVVCVNLPKYAECSFLISELSKIDGVLEAYAD